MRQYLLIETRDAADHHGAAEAVELAIGIAGTGAPCAMLLTENAAFSARNGVLSPIESAISAGVEIRVDRFAMAERAISDDELKPGIAVGGPDFVVDHLLDGSRVIWR